MPAHKIPLGVRFWAKVEKSDGCWLWIGARSGDGYGHIKIDGHMVKAHRVGFELAGGFIPDGLDLDHLCRTPLCVRAEHLEPVTRRENTRRGHALSALRSHQTHCKRGHEFTQANTYVYRSSRTCRTCRSDYDSRRKRATA